MKIHRVFKTEHSDKYEQEMYLRRSKMTKAFKEKPDQLFDGEKDSLMYNYHKVQCTSVVQTNIVLMQNKGSIMRGLGVCENSNKGKVEVIYRKCRRFLQSIIPGSL